MSYIVSIIPKKATTQSSTFLRQERFASKKLPVLRKLLRNKKVTPDGAAEAVVAYKTRIDALGAAAKVRNHVHGVTAKVYSSAEYGW